MPEEQSRQLTREEIDALTKDLQAVLEKHNAEMGITSTINLLRVNKNESDTTKESETNTETEKSS